MSSLHLSWLMILLLAVWATCLTSCTSRQTRTRPHGGDVVAIDDQTKAELVTNSKTGQAAVFTWDSELSKAKPKDLPRHGRGHVQRGASRL